MVNVFLPICLECLILIIFLLTHLLCILGNKTSSLAMPMVNIDVFFTKNMAGVSLQNITVHAQSSHPLYWWLNKSAYYLYQSGKCQVDTTWQFFHPISVNHPSRRSNVNAMSSFAVARWCDYQSIPFKAFLWYLDHVYQYTFSSMFFSNSLT